MNRILHRNSSTIDQAPKSQFSHFLNEPLNVADGGSFEGVIEQSYSLLPGATKFPEQAGYFAQVVYLLAKAHNPRNADLGNINAGRLPKTIEGYVGKKMQII